MKIINETMAPFPYGKTNDVDVQALRLSIISELDAISLYEKLAEIVKNKDIKKILLDVAKEEKTHVSEFETLLSMYDKEQSIENKNGKKEVSDKLTSSEPIKEATNHIFGKTQSESFSDMIKMFKKLNG